MSDSDNIICACKDIEYAEFINNDVVTGIMKIFKHPKLIKFAEFGPKFREPVSIDFDKLDSHCCTSVLEFVKKWSNFENIALSVFNGWYDKFKSLIKCYISDLKRTYSKKKKFASILMEKEISECLYNIHDKFVVCPVDKASKNFAVVCNSFYKSLILNELTPVNGYVSVKDNTSKIFTDTLEFTRNLDNNILVDMENKRLPHITAYPKFHKIKLSERFVISYASCFIKPLSRSICLALKSIYSCIVNYCNMLNTVTGIDHNWMIQNNSKIVDCLEHINSNGLARNIQTYDFSTLYTKLDHVDIKKAMTFIINLAFNRNKSKPFISVYNNSSNFVKKPRSSTIYFDNVSLINRDTCIS